MEREGRKQMEREGRKQSERELVDFTYGKRGKIHMKTETQK